MFIHDMIHSIYSFYQTHNMKTIHPIRNHPHHYQYDRRLLRSTYNIDISYSAITTGSMKSYASARLERS
jgi:hypothetical protein